jgi:rubrerythrin
MKKWRCMICGYEHSGSDPPHQCPFCGAPRKMFEELCT